MFHFNKKPTFEQHDNEKENYYQNSSTKIDFISKLEDSIDADICIIGGGLTGISSALYLSKKGYKIVLIEARKIGWGASGRNGGQLGGGLRKDQKEVENKLGINQAKELWNLGIEAVEEVKENIKKYNIDCDLVNGVLTAGYYKDDETYFKNEAEHLLKQYNYDKYYFLNFSDIREEIDSKKYYSGLLNKGSYHLHPLKYLYGLAKEAKKNGVKIYENSPVSKILKKSDFLEVSINKYKIKCNLVVVGCNGYLDNLLGNIRNKFMPINNYILATESVNQDYASAIIKNNYAVCDTRFIIDYYRFSKDNRMLFGGGETFTSKFLENPKNFVKKRMNKVFPQLSKLKIDFCWGGTLAITVNRLPSFGSLNNNIIYAHGYSGHGVALSTLAGKLISEYVTGNKDRFHFFSSIQHQTIPGGDFVRRPIYSSAVAYYKLRDFIH